MKQGEILIADDELLIRDFLEVIMREKFRQYNLNFFQDGSSLGSELEKAATNGNGNIRLVITDNQMPGECGSKIIEEYASKLKEIYFILHYGGADAIGKEAIKNGAFGYLIKPVHPEKLIGLVSEALGEEIK